MRSCQPRRRSHLESVVALGVAVFAAAACHAALAPAPVPPLEPVAVGASWLEYARPEEAGFSAGKLDAARQLADDRHSAALMAIYRGHVIAAWGDVGRNLMAHSVRKSFVDALCGIAIAEGKLSAEATLGQLGIDDQPPLSGAEKAAKVRDLLAARSGVYHAAAYAASEQDAERPARGSHPPGTFWFYNNWDFNALETIYERATGEDVFAGFASRIAKPLAMEDYDPARGLAVLEPGSSRIPAHAFRISARDMARFGLLFLQEGRWGERQLISAEWVRESLRVHSDLGEGTGYGYLWWIYSAGSLGKNYPVLDRMDVYLARGSGGQAIFVIPGADLVVVHRGDSDNDRGVSGKVIWSLVEQIAAARVTAPVATPALRPMTPRPFASQMPEPPAPKLVALDEAALDGLAGDYQMVGTGRGVIRVFREGRRLFVDVPEQGEAELFALSPDEFTVLVAAGIHVTFIRGPDGRATRLEAIIGSQRMAAERKGTE